MITAGISNISATLSMPMSEDQLQSVTDQMETYNQFRNADPVLFSKMAKSKSELADFEIWDLHVNKNKEAPRNVAEQMRLIKKRPPIEKFNLQQLESIDDSVNSIVDNFLDEKGDTIFALWQRTPENKAELEQAARGAYEEALRITRGDINYATAVTQQIMMRNAAVIDNKWIPDGEKILKNMNGYDPEAFKRGQNSRPEKRSA